MRKLRQHALAIILVIAAVLRLYGLGNLPIALNWDEVSMGYSAYSLAETGKDEWGAAWPLFFRSYGEWKSAAYIYLIVPFVKFMGLNAWAVRLPSALAGILAVYGMYLLGKEIYSRRVGLWAALLMAVTPWHLVVSRPAFEANLALTFYIFGLYGLLRALRTQSWWSLLLAGFGFGLAPHTYNSAKVVVPLLGSVLVATAARRLGLRRLLVLALIWGVCALPILANLQNGVSQKRLTQVGLTTELDKLNAFTGYRATIPGAPIFGKLIFNRVTYTAYHLVDNLASYFDPAYLTINGGPHNQYRVPFHGILYVTAYLLALAGLGSLMTSERLTRLKQWLPLLLIVLGLIPAALTKGDHHVLRSLLALPGWLLLASVGAVSLDGRASWLRRGVIVALVFECTLFLSMYFGWYRVATATDWQYGYKEAIAYVTAHQADYDHIVMTKWYGEPHLFVAFYTAWDPLDFQRENAPLLRYEAEGRAWLDQLEPYQVGNWEFKYLNWVAEAKTPRTLYIGKPDDFWPDSHVVETIRDPSGKPIFLLVEP